MSSTETAPSPPRAGITLADVLCFLAIMVPTAMLSGAGFASWSQQLFESADSSMAGLACIAMPLGLVLGGFLATWVVRWRRADEPRPWLQQLLYVLILLLVLAPIVAPWTPSGRSYDYLRMYLRADETMESLERGVPAGGVVCFAGPEAEVPDGYVVADGRSLRRTKHEALYSWLGTEFGGDDRTFRLPDLRGVLHQRWDETETRTYYSELVVRPAPGARAGRDLRPLLWLIKTGS